MGKDFDVNGFKVVERPEGIEELKGSHNKYRELLRAVLKLGATDTIKMTVKDFERRGYNKNSLKVSARRLKIKLVITADDGYYYIFPSSRLPKGGDEE